MNRNPSMDAARVGERLRIARTAAGLTQEQAAERMKFARTTLVAIERGDRSARPEELLAFSEVYKVSVHSLLRQTAVKVDVVGQFRRSKPGGDVDPEGAAAIQLLHDLAAACVELERRLNKPSHFDYPAERRIGRGRLDLQAEEIAAAVRTRLGIGLGPIPDLVALLELELGVRVFIRPLASAIAGVYAFHEEIGGCILINKLHPRPRRRWSMAHELAHFMTTRNEPAVEGVSAVGKSKEDTFADLFAAAFLMPSATVRRIFDEYVGADGRFSARHLILGAHRFGVSLEAFGRRLERLDLLPAGTFDMLRERGLSEAAVRDVLGDESTNANVEPTPRLLLLAAEAHERGLYSEGQLADMLVIDRVDLRRSLDAFSSLDDISSGEPL